MEQPTFTLRDAINGIRRRRTSVVVVFLLIVTAVAAMTLMSTKVYSSTSKLFVRLGRENAGLDATATLGERPVVSVPLSREAEINSVVQLIKSQQLFGQVVDEIGTEHILDGTNPNPESDGDSSSASPSSQRSQWLPDSLIPSSVPTFLKSIGVMNDIPEREVAVNELKDGIKIVPIERSNVISVSYEAKEPELARLVVETLVSRYIDAHGRLHRNEGAYKFLLAQADQTEKELRLKELELEKFKTESGILSAEEQRSVIIDRIAQLENRLLEAETSATSLTAEIEQINERFKKLSPTQVVSETTGAGNDGIDGMRQELFRLQVRHEELLATLPPNHPQISAVEKAIASAQKILATDEAQRTESEMGPNKIYEELQIQLFRKEPLLVGMAKTISAVKTQLEVENKGLSAFNELERKFMELTRDVTLLDEKYRRYKRNVEQAGVDTSLNEHNLSNISVSQPATMSEKPVRPRKMVNLLLGVFFGLAGSLGLAVFREYMQTSTDDAGNESGSVIPPALPDSALTHSTSSDPEAADSNVPDSETGYSE